MTDKVASPSLLEEHVNTLNLNNKFMMIFADGEITKIDQLVQMTEADFLRRTQCELKDVGRVRRALAEKGLTFRSSI